MGIGICHFIVFFLSFIYHGLVARIVLSDSKWQIDAGECLNRFSWFIESHGLFFLKLNVLAVFIPTATRNIAEHFTVLGQFVNNSRCNSESCE